MRVPKKRVGFSGSKLRAWGPKATLGVVTGPRRTAPELSESLFNDPLWVNDLIPTAARK